jgi:hypothetical protein
VVCAIITAAGVHSFWQVTQTGAPIPRASVYRTVGSITCYVCEMAGAVALFAWATAGLYLAAASMMANFFFMISGSWLLLMGVSRDEEQATGSQ